eukprot:TRINITY_DN4337_c0_g1_i4.p2 TRINITY_DN4337_c0_g1~~TRINITY_DN4337_c0_g1_i4.p2  ORF type:complete len:269 (+),score=55.68 TRINITY_DN4337_c0_g1_i4:99-905(+)
MMQQEKSKGENLDPLGKQQNSHIFAVRISFQQMSTKEDKLLDQTDFNRKHGNLASILDMQITMIDLQQASEEKGGVKVRLDLTPVLPLPVLLRPYIECTDEKGHHHGFAIPFILVDLPRFFLGFPTKLTPEIKILQLFDVMWDTLSQQTRKKKFQQKIVVEDEGEKENKFFGLDDEIQGSIVPKIFEQDSEFVCQCLRESMPQCCLEGSEGNDLKVLIFLPPQYHVLIRVTPLKDEDGCKLVVVTDFWPCLPYLDVYLDELLLKKQLS